MGSRAGHLRHVIASPVGQATVSLRSDCMLGVTCASSSSTPTAASSNGSDKASVPSSVRWSRRWMATVGRHAEVVLGCDEDEGVGLVDQRAPRSRVRMHVASAGGVFRLVEERKVHLGQVDDPRLELSANVASSDSPTMSCTKRLVMHTSMTVMSDADYDVLSTLSETPGNRWHCVHRGRDRGWPEDHRRGGSGTRPVSAGELHRPAFAGRDRNSQGNRTARRRPPR